MVGLATVALAVRWSVAAPPEAMVPLKRVPVMLPPVMGSTRQNRSQSSRGWDVQIGETVTLSDVCAAVQQDGAAGFANGDLGREGVGEDRWCHVLRDCWQSEGKESYESRGDGTGMHDGSNFE